MAKPRGYFAGARLKSGLTFMDLGCGPGFFALPAARMVGKSGKVYGVDINPGSIQELATWPPKKGWIISN